MNDSEGLKMGELIMIQQQKNQRQQRSQERRVLPLKKNLMSLLMLSHPCCNQKRICFHHLKLEGYTIEVSFIPM